MKWKDEVEASDKKEREKRKERRKKRGERGGWLRRFVV